MTNILEIYFFPKVPSCGLNNYKRATPSSKQSSELILARVIFTLIC
jgi:hypothetical protein